MAVVRKDLKHQRLVPAQASHYSNPPPGSYHVFNASPNARTRLPPAIPRDAAHPDPPPPDSRGSEPCLPMPEEKNDFSQTFTAIHPRFKADITPRLSSMGNFDRLQGQDDAFRHVQKHMEYQDLFALRRCSYGLYKQVDPLLASERSKQALLFTAERTFPKHWGKVGASQSKASTWSDWKLLQHVDSKDKQASRLSARKGKRNAKKDGVAKRETPTPKITGKKTTSDARKGKGGPVAPSVGCRLCWQILGPEHFQDNGRVNYATVKTDCDRDSGKPGEHLVLLQPGDIRRNFHYVPKPIPNADNLDYIPLHCSPIGDRPATYDITVPMSLLNCPKDQETATPNNGNRKKDAHSHTIVPDDWEEHSLLAPVMVGPTVLRPPSACPSFLPQFHQHQEQRGAEYGSELSPPSYSLNAQQARPDVIALRAFCIMCGVEHGLYKPENSIIIKTSTNEKWWMCRCKVIWNYNRVDKCCDCDMNKPFNPKGAVNGDDRDVDTEYGDGDDVSMDGMTSETLSVYYDT